VIKILKYLWIVALCLVAGSALSGGAEQETRTIVVMGDSLSAGYNLPPGAAFPAQLEIWLTEKGAAVVVVNAAVSGDTSAGGLARMEWAVSGQPGTDPDLVIVEFGGNDALRGFEPSLTRSNLAQMIETLKDHQIPVLLAGMRAPPNMGREYETEFNGLYADLAKKYGVYFYPFFLEGVAAIPELNLSDGIHPNEKGIAVIIEKIGPFVLAALNGE
jgi:acyl-CoA thioesterase-1